MNTDAERPMIGERFAMDAVANAIEKKWTGGYEIRGSSVVFSELWVFQKGAILGRAKADKIEILIRLLAVEGREESILTLVRNKATELLDSYGEEPSSFFDFYMKSMLPSLDFTNLNMLKTLHKRKYRLGEILPKFQTDVAIGIGLGTMNPDLVKKMWVESYEKGIDQTSWAEARKHGLDIPEKQTHLPLKEIEELVLLETSEFASEYYPELVAPLGLTKRQDS